MNKPKTTKIYSELEEKLNVISHGIGFILSIIALVLLIVRSSLYGTAYHIVSFTIFGSSLVVLYMASTLYHNAKKEKTRNRLNIFDHASIYVLIAGTYTPYVLVSLNGTIGWTLFGITWGAAALGVTLKLFFIGRYEKLSTILYVLMGWVIIIAIKPLIENLSTEGFVWLLSGGIFYTIGAVSFSVKRLKLNHAIFHLFVLLGSISHFISIYFYVLPLSD
jgi:hemolysin III